MEAGECGPCMFDATDLLWGRCTFSSNRSVGPPTQSESLFYFHFFSWSQPKPTGFCGIDSQDDALGDDCEPEPEHWKRRRGNMICSTGSIWQLCIPSTQLPDLIWSEFIGWLTINWGNFRLQSFCFRYLVHKISWKHKESQVCLHGISSPWVQGCLSRCCWY